MRILIKCLFCWFSLSKKLQDGFKTKQSTVVCIISLWLAIDTVLSNPNHFGEILIIKHKCVCVHVCEKLLSSSYVMWDAIIDFFSNFRQNWDYSNKCWIVLRKQKQNVLHIEIIHCNQYYDLDPFYLHRLTKIMTWISNYIHSFIWDVITHQCLNFNGGLTPSLKLGMDE